MTESKRKNCNSPWLKKYMKINYLWDLLEKNQIHLGNSDRWEDRNDHELIELYRNRSNIKSIRITCMTTALDRFHFWKIFGAGIEGVCLWFNKKEFKVKIDQDKSNDLSLKSDEVIYRTVRDLDNCKVHSKLPFSKRDQYGDEQEYRIFREFECADPANEANYEFDPKSLERIYFNSWLDNDSYEALRCKTIEKLKPNYGHIPIERNAKGIMQNRVLEYDKWINAAKNLK